MAGGKSQRCSAHRPNDDLWQFCHKCNDYRFLIHRNCNAQSKELMWCREGPMPLRITGPNSEMSVRQKAKQDLSALRARLAETERALIQLRSEERELLVFLKRLSRYEPEDSNDVDENKSTGSTAGSFVFKNPANFSLHAQRAAISSPTPSVPKDRSRRGIVNKEAFDYLDFVGGHASTAELLNHIRSNKKAFSFLGTNPLGTLSSYLSRDPRFSFEKSEGGWRLIPFDDENHTDQGSLDAQGEPEEGGEL